MRMSLSVVGLKGNKGVLTEAAGWVVVEIGLEVLKVEFI